jgi:hypothetical protein
MATKGRRTLKKDRLQIQPSIVVRQQVSIMESRRYFWGVVSYWLLFIIAPTVAAFFLLGASVKSGGFCIGILSFWFY